VTRFAVSILTEDRQNGIEGEFDALTQEAAIAKAREYWGATEEEFPVGEARPL
jgi:hypothetical protein